MRPADRAGAGRDSPEVDQKVTLLSDNDSQ
jgi:hypothetical protein